MAAIPKWAEILATTLERRLPGVEEALERHRPFFKMQKARGTTKYNEGGHAHTWNVRKKHLRLYTYIPGDEHHFERTTTQTKATVEWRQLAMGDTLFEMDLLMNKGAQAVIKLWKDHQSLMEASMYSQFPRKILTIDGNAVGNEEEIWGFPTVFGSSGVATADGKRMKPSATYAGISTQWGTFGGTTEADDQFKGWSPELIDYTGAGWIDPNTQAVIAAPSWVKTCLLAMRFGIIQLRANNRSGQRASYILLPKDMWNDARDQLARQESYAVQRTVGKEEGLLLNAGFEAFNYDGVEVTWDEDQPAKTGYIVDASTVHLLSMRKKLFDKESEYWMSNNSYRWLMKFAGQEKFVSPRRLGMLYPFT